jgi:DNA topoisomerase-1
MPNKKSSKRQAQPPPIITDPVESAKAAGLRYVSDTKPGITRQRAGKSFSYLDTDGKTIRAREDIERIKSLAIPPAWTDVWICPLANGHLQATGRDARGRKQYRYHERWRAVRDETKFGKMMLFGETLPTIRKRVEHDLALSGLPREKVLATIVRLLETTFIRVGNEEYARTNKSFGLTTMRNRHVDVTGSTLHFQFRGKSGVDHAIELNDRRVAKIVQHCLDIPGYELFRYLDDNNEPHTVDSADVNEYLREITGQDFTAKDFRTWAGTVLAGVMLREYEAFDSDTQAKKNIVSAVEAVAERLGNTPTVCRKCYVHPAIIDSYLDGSMMKTLEQRIEDEMKDSKHALRPEEKSVMKLLQRTLQS